MLSQKIKKTQILLFIAILFLFIGIIMIFGFTKASKQNGNLPQEELFALFSEDDNCLNPCWRQIEPNISHDHEIKNALFADPSTTQPDLRCIIVGAGIEQCSWVDIVDNVSVRIAINNGIIEYLMLTPPNYSEQSKLFTFASISEHLGTPDRYSAIGVGGRHGEFNTYFTPIYSEIGIALSIQEFGRPEFDVLAVTPNMAVKAIYFFDVESPDAIFDGENGRGTFVGQIQMWNDSNKIPIEIYALGS